MSRNVAVIAGATGLTGSYLVRILLEDAFFDHVVTIGRRDLPFRHTKLRQIIVDFNRLDPAHLAGATHLFCALGTTMRAAGGKEAFRKVDLDAVVAFAQAGKAAGATRMLTVSSVGANPQSGTFYLRVKGEMEAALTEAGFEALYLLQPSLLLGVRAEVRAGERISISIMRTFEGLLLGPLRKYRPIEAPVVARAMAVAAERGESGVHRLLYDDIVRMAG